MTESPGIEESPVSRSLSSLPVRIAAYIVLVILSLLSIWVIDSHVMYVAEHGQAAASERSTP